MRANILTASLMCSFGIGFQGCQIKASALDSTRFATEFRVISDDGHALAGSRISAGNLPLGITGDDGRLSADLVGVEGTVLPVKVACPAGFASPDKPVPLRLTHTRRPNSSHFQAMHVDTTCMRQVRDIVVVVRAERGAGLPLQIDGRPSGTTDADGIAHVLVRADRNVKSISASLDTSARKDLNPKNPSRSYKLTGNDAVLMFDQTFVATPRGGTRSGSTKRRNHVPYRIY